jgi:hypothetical protein
MAGPPRSPGSLPELGPERSTPWWPMPVADRSELPPQAVQDRASKATTAMGAAMAPRSADSRRWASISASLSVLAGAGGDAWSAGAGLVRGVPTVAGRAPILRSGILSNQRSPAGESCAARVTLPSCSGLGRWANQGDEYGENHDDEDGADNVEDSAIGPHHWHARRRESGWSAKLVVVARSCHCSSAFRRIVRTVLCCRVSATRGLPSTPASAWSRPPLEPLALKSGAPVRNDGQVRTDSAHRRWRPRTVRGGERGKAQRFQWQLAAAWASRGLGC